MVKRFSALLGALLLAAVLLWPVAVSAEAGDIRIEQVQAELPDVRAYFHLEGDAAEPPQVAATMDNKTLELVQLRRYDPALDPTSYFFLVDCSTSTSYAQMEAVKTALNNFAAAMPTQATMTLITFGVDVQVVLQREADPAAIAVAVAQLAANQPGTVFFDALAKAIDLAGNSDYALERKLAFVFSDSVDYNLGGYTKEEIDKLLVATGLPFYALGFDTGSKQELDNFGAVARSSGGTIAVVSAEGLPAALEEMVALTAGALVADFTTGTNVVGAGAQVFSLSVPATGKTAEMQVPVRFWKPDTTAPEVLKLTQHSAESIELAFSEPVQGATKAESFTVKNEKGDLLGIRAAAYDETAHTVTLTFTEAPPSGTLAVECPGVTDVSMEENKVAGSGTIAFEGAATPPKETAPAPGAGVPVGAWVFIGIVAVGLIVAIAVATTRKRNAAAATAMGQSAAGTGPQHLEVDQPLPAGDEMQVHFAQSQVPLPRIKLNVTAASGASRVVEVPINKTLFVGRSDICDVYFDDTTMSRQHFVIGEENGNYTITNLSTSGGTLLNGVPLQNPRPLKDGDTIGAGQQSMVFFTAPAGGKVQ